jgi:hypothetical protein
MLKMQTCVAALGLLSVAAAPAPTTDWHLVDPKSGECKTIRAAGVGGPQDSTARRKSFVILMATLQLSRL